MNDTYFSDQDDTNTTDDQHQTDDTQKTDTKNQDSPAKDETLEYQPAAIDEVAKDEPISASDADVKEIEDPRITDRDKSFKHIFGNSNDNDDFFPKFKKTDLTKDDGHIEVQQYDIPSKSDDVSKKEEKVEEKTEKAASQTPHMSAFDHVDANRAVAMTATISMLVLVFGLGGGFFGYKYLPGLMQKASVSADTFTAKKTVDATPSPTPTEITSPTASPTPTASLKTYTNTKYKYALSFPSSWFNQNSDNTTADNLTLSSTKIASSGTDTNGYKVEITFQNSNGKLLKDWIADDNTLAGYGKPELTDVKVDGKTAYQQVITAGSKSINTYVFQANKVMVISYFAPAKDFVTGKTFYQNIVSSIKLN